jgi:hypothetical protein
MEITSMPMKRELYPPHWELISRRIIKGRAQDQCEWIENGTRCGAINGQPHPITGSKVVLTTAHLENENPMDCRYENLMAMCQKHHLAYDRRRKEIETL